MVRPEADWNTVSRRLARLKGVSYVFNERCHRAQAKLFVTYGMSAAVGKACAPKR